MNPSEHPPLSPEHPKGPDASCRQHCMHKAGGGQDSPLKTNTAVGQVRIPLQAQSPIFIKMPHFITETRVVMVERIGCGGVR